MSLGCRLCHLWDVRNHWALHPDGGGVGWCHVSVGALPPVQCGLTTPASPHLPLQGNQRDKKSSSSISSTRLHSFFFSSFFWNVWLFWLILGWLFSLMTCIISLARNTCCWSRGWTWVTVWRRSCCTSRFCTLSGQTSSPSSKWRLWVVTVPWCHYVNYSFSFFICLHKQSAVIYQQKNYGFCLKIKILGHCVLYLNWEWMLPNGIYLIF